VLVLVQLDEHRLSLELVLDELADEQEQQEQHELDEALLLVGVEEVGDEMILEHEVMVLMLLVLLDEQDELDEHQQIDEEVVGVEAEVLVLVLVELEVRVVHLLLE